MAFESKLAAGFTFVAGAAAAIGASAQPGAPAHPREWTEVIAPLRIADRIYYVGSRDLAAYLIDGGSGLILLDAGLPEFAPQVLNNVRRLGFDPRKIRILLSSQAHLDHAGGLAAIKAATGARMVASRKDAALLTRGGRNDPHWGDTLLFPAVKVDAFVRDGEQVAVGSARLTAHLTPGHSKGCTTWTMPVTVDGRVRTAQFLCGMSAPGYKLLGTPAYPDMADDFRRTFTKLRGLRCDVFLGAHGSYYGLDAKRAKLASGARGNPFVDPEGCRRYVDQAEKRVQDQLTVERTAMGDLYK